MVKATSHAKQHHGGWLSDQAQAALPNVNRDFAQNRDPLAVRQLADMGKTENQHREEQADGGAANKKAQSNPRKTDKPALVLKPPPHMRASNGWLWAQQRAALSNIAPSKAQETPQRDSPAHNQGHAPEL